MNEHLKKILKQPDTVLFIGSGVSLWSGLPTWWGLIKQLSGFLEENGFDSSLVEQELTKGELLQAASYGFDKLTPQQIGQFIRNACKLGVAQPHHIHELIVNLGPSCFVTTNYDNLLELSFQKWLTNKHIRKITNRMLVETAEIVGARSSNFLFKLHGDVEDSSSIILTREQYKILNQGGELHHALDAIKTLQLSRPFVYIGFGLRDPDFLYVRDLLANTYKGGARDHYGIVADISEAEIDYWKRNYGIHLIGYKTTQNEDGSNSHQELINLLKSLTTNVTEKKTKTVDKNDSEIILKLTRHAARFLKNDKEHEIIPLEVYPEESNRDNDFGYRFYGASVEKLLDKGPKQFILIGLPGSGKTFAITNSIARLSRELHDNCLSTDFNSDKIVIPLLVDLKEYQGSILDLIESSLPSGIEFEFLTSNFKVKLYFDSFNEMPANFIEDNEWDKDFESFAASFPEVLYVIASRTVDGLTELDIPIYRIDSIAKEFVEEKLLEANLVLPDSYSTELLLILRRPIFYKLALEGKIQLSDETKPSSIYEGYLKLLTADLRTRFKSDFEITPVFAELAEKAIDSGKEVINISEAIRKIKQVVQESTDYNDVLNWLIGREFIIPNRGKKFSFFHQSMTEFLAASTLAKNYLVDANVLKTKLKNRNWDQALFLTLNLLPDKKATDFLETVIKYDFNLALIAVRYVDEDQESIVSKLLLEIKDRYQENFETMSSLGHRLTDSLPLTKKHIPILMDIIECKNILGGSAAAKVIALNDNDSKTLGFKLLVENCTDYNFCTGVARELKKCINQFDITELVEMAETVQKKLDAKEIDNFEGFDSALGMLLEGINPNIVYEAFFDTKQPIERQKVKISVLSDFLTGMPTQEGLNITAKLLIQGVTDVVVSIYFILYFVDKNIKLDLSMFSKEHIKKLVLIIQEQNNEDAGWALSSLKEICKHRPEVNSIVQDFSKDKKGVLLSALKYLSSNEEAISALKSLLTLDDEKLKLEPFDLIGQMELNWDTNEKLLIQLLQKRNIHLAFQLCETIDSIYENANIPKLKLENLEWWLEWIHDAPNLDSNNAWVFTDRISRLISRSIDSDEKKFLIREFNKPESNYRKILSVYLLPKIDGLNLADFTDESISYMINNIQSEISGFRGGGLLKKISTEEFVNNTLIYHYHKAQEKEKVYFRKAIEEIGRKHGRRYLIE